MAWGATSRRPCYHNDVHVDAHPLWLLLDPTMARDSSLESMLPRADVSAAHANGAELMKQFLPFSPLVARVRIAASSTRPNRLRLFMAYSEYLPTRDTVNDGHRCCLRADEADGYARWLPFCRQRSRLQRSERSFRRRSVDDVYRRTVSAGVGNEHLHVRILPRGAPLSSNDWQLDHAGGKRRIA